tara:strand:+ start:1282 stop:1590 length:309 start_codon:yes stop_codon:yes gene_type:complete
MNKKKKNIDQLEVYNYLIPKDVPSVLAGIGMVIERQGRSEGLSPSELLARYKILLPAGVADNWDVVSLSSLCNLETREISALDFEKAELIFVKQEIDNGLPF